MTIEILRSTATGSRPARPPILFVHGAYCSAQVWVRRFMPYFSNHGYDCHALSLRGHGASDGALSWACLADYVDDVAAVITTLPAPPILIGHALGGLVVQHLLAKRSARAALLLATLPPSGLSSAAMHMSMLAPDILWQLGLLQSLGPEAISADAITRAWLSSGASAETVSDLMACLQRESPRVAAELLAPSQPRPVTGDNKPPIMVLGGDADVFMPVSAFREAAIYFSTEMTILKGAPHGLMIDDRWWQKTADEILGWLGRVVKS